MEYAATKLPATISIDEKIKDGLVESVLDDSNFMYLGKKNGTQRDVLFLFAMALGWSHNLTSDLAKPCSGGFIRTSSFASQLAALIDLVRFESGGYKEPNTLRDHKESYRIAERYANAGFHLLEGEVKSHKDSETFANELIQEMDEMYASFFPSTTGKQ